MNLTEDQQKHPVAVWVAQFLTRNQQAKSPQLLGIRLDDTATAISPLPRKSMLAAIRSRSGTAILHAIFGVHVEYQAGKYHASGRGPFGHYGGGRKAYKSDPAVIFASAVNTPVVSEEAAKIVWDIYFAGKEEAAS